MVARLAAPTENPIFVTHEPDTERPGGGPRDSRLPERNLARSLARRAGRTRARRGRNARKVCMRRVVVTGMGMVTPLGRDLESTWSALLAGKSGVGPITLFDARTFPTRIAAEVADFRLEDYIDDAGRWAEHSRNSKFALAAASMAMKDSGLLDCKPELNRRRFGVYLGSGEGQQDFPRFVSLVHRSTRDGRVDTAEFTRLGVKELHAVREAEQEPGTPSGHLASLFGAEGSTPTA